MLKPSTEELDHSSSHLLTVLVSHLSQGTVRPGHPESYITYQDTHRRLGLTCDAEGNHHYGQCLKRNGLDSLGHWLRDSGRPAITGLIVKKNGSPEPGDGFFDLFRPPGNPYEWWEDQIRRSMEPISQWQEHIVSTPEGMDVFQATESAIQVMSHASETECDLLENAGGFDEVDDPLNSQALLDLLERFDETEVLAIVKARTRQSRFRKSLIERWAGCSVSGCRLTEVLIASHIKPWSLCKTYHERVGVANGLLLTPNLDKLFDEGLITFDDNMRITISPLLPPGWCSQLGIDQNMRIRQRYEDIIPNLAWHRKYRYYETKERRALRANEVTGTLIV